MANTKLTDLTELAATPEVDDWFYIVDTSATASKKLLGKYLVRTDGNTDGVTITGGGIIALAGYTLTALGSGNLVTLTGTQTLTNKTITTPTLTLKQGVNPTPTAEGAIEWETDTDQIHVGDGSGTKVFSNDSVTVVHGATGAVVGTTNTQTLTNKTLTTPTIGDFTNATHGHADNAGGGVLDVILPTCIRMYGGALSTTSTSYGTTQRASTSVWLDAGKIKAPRTIKLYAYMYSGNASATASVELYNGTSAAAVTGGTLTSTSTSAELKSTNDLRSAMGSGLDQFYIRIKTSSASYAASLVSAMLVIN